MFKHYTLFKEKKRYNESYQPFHIDYKNRFSTLKFDFYEKLRGSRMNVD